MTIFVRPKRSSLISVAILHQVIVSVIHDKNVETVSAFKYLGTIIDRRLRWDTNTQDVVKKTHQRFFLLRKLNSSSPSDFFASFIDRI